MARRKEDQLMKDFTDTTLNAAKLDRTKQEAEPTTCVVLTDEDIKAVTDLARSLGGACAARRWNAKNPDKPVSDRAVQRYKLYYDRNRAYYVPVRRGP
ncbi:hypothetical protein DIPPA_65552, partial [Diplonema papillatum]